MNTAAHDAPAIDYGTKQRPNYAAMASLALGLMLFVPLVTGGLAIFFGRRGMRAARESFAGRYHMARAGFILGLVNVLLSITAACVYGVHEYHASKRRQCAANLRQIGNAILMYSNSHRGQYPPTFDELVTTGQLPKGSAVFNCPVCRGKKAATVSNVVTSSYVLGPPWKPKLPLRYYGNITFVVAFEPLSNHEGRGMHVLTNHGEVTWVDAPLAAKVMAELKSGENPPDSLKGIMW